MIDYHNHDASLGEGAYLELGRGTFHSAPLALAFPSFGTSAKNPELKNPSRAAPVISSGKAWSPSYDVFMVCGFETR